MGIFLRALKITQWTEHLPYKQEDLSSGPQNPRNTRHVRVSVFPVLLGQKGRWDRKAPSSLPGVNCEQQETLFQRHAVPPWLSSSPQHLLPAFPQSQSNGHAFLSRPLFFFSSISFLGATNQIPDCAQPTLKQNVTEPSWLLASIFVVSKSKLP